MSHHEKLIAAFEASYLSIVCLHVLNSSIQFCKSGKMQWGGVEPPLSHTEAGVVYRYYQHITKDGARRIELLFAP